MDTKNITQIMQELNAVLVQTESTDRFTSLDCLLPRIRTTLARLDAIRWGDRLKDGESVEALALRLASDAVRVLNEFRQNSPVDPDW